MSKLPVLNAVETRPCGSRRDADENWTSKKVVHYTIVWA